ncbi:MAG: topoisomerase C-terminal repeat-containing protein [Clostridia bacterium]|nr:topoisomerase C-terminal repeat-containing protein [Clostridia bacterium]MBQ9807188.1 topoisomerase C-terminal repeat-containing protein [Clostridia bacterium]
MILIIAEKPSLARNIAAAIGNLQKRNGYLEGEGYLITWAFGHLFSLCDIEAYRPQEDGSTRWSLNNLPCFPEQFRFELRRGADKKVDSGVVRQFEVIRSLCNRPDVETVVNAGDADREGEIIVRLCVDHALTSPKSLKRLWLPDQTPQTVSKALTEMKDEAEYERLASEGFARTYIDWLYGVNLTRYATLKTGTLLRVGRVIVPIVKAIYDRDMAIRNFVPGKYFAMVSKEKTNGELVELTSKNKFEQEKYAEALRMCELYNRTGAVVTGVKNKKDTLSAGKLFSLSKLQNALSKKYKMSMQESLDIVQGLYEKGYLTYPRTNSEYLATAEKDKIRQILSNCQKLGYPVKFKDSKSIFDDSKIESHSALTPTYKIPNKNQLSEREMQVYSTVFRRFVAVFCAEDCVVTRSEITIAVGELETFVLKGMVILEKGWTKYDDYNQKDKVLPALNKGDAVNIDFKPTEKETTPPKHYTVETLNNYLKNPFKDEKKAAREAAEAEAGEVSDDSEDYRAIFEGLELGTEATRTGIIDNARKSGYIELKKDVYTILPGGEFLIEALTQMQITMDKYKTSELGQALKKVYRGTMTVEESVKLAEQEIAEVFEKKANADLSLDSETGFFGDVVATCPLCGKDMKRFRSFYGCTGYKDGCKFSVNISICGRAISVANLKLLTDTGKTAVIQGFVSPRTKKSFDAALKLENGRAVFDFEARAPRKDAATAPRRDLPIWDGEGAPPPDDPPPGY